jgi:hypothetical protein
VRGPEEAHANSGARSNDEGEQDENPERLQEILWTNGVWLNRFGE